MIIPTLNEEQYLGRLLDFFGGYTDDRLVEVIIVDGNSCDCTFEIAQRWKEQDHLSCKTVRMDKSSRTAQLQFGANLASGDTLYFVHADTLPPCTFLDDVEDAINRGADLGSFRFSFESDRILLRINSWFTRFNTPCVRGGDQTLFVKQAVFHALRGFCSRHVIMEEYDFLKRAKESGYVFSLIQKDVRVSDRKYHENSYLRVNVANLVAMTSFRMGRDPKKIKETYHGMLRHPKA